MIPANGHAATVKAPYAVQIAPNMGELKVKEKVRLQQVGPNLHSFNIYLPASVSVQAGFTVSVSGFTLNSIGRKLMLPEDDPAASARGQLVNKLREARLERSRLDGLEKSLNARIAMWQNQAAQQSNLSNMPQAADLEKVDAALSAKLPEIYGQLAQLPAKKQKVDQLVAYLQNELNALGGERVQLAEVTVTLAGTTPQGVNPVEVEAEYSYISFNCAWWPSYSFEADPARGLVRFKQQANIRQNSGQDWNNVQLSLSTKAMDFKTTPNNLHAWHLYREAPPAPRSSKMYEMAAAEPMMDSEMVMEEVAQNTAVRPVSMELATHREWSIGKVNLSSVNPACIELEQKNWKGDFFYTLRPSVEEYAYLTALVELDAPVELPRGEAIFIVDNRLAGHSTGFSANTNELYLYFGKDDMVSVEMRDLVSMKGEERFILKTNTYNWHWEITAKNMRNRNVKVRVEDPMPKIRDASIKLKVDSTPKAQEKHDYYFWEKEISSGGSFVINHRIEARASGSEPIIPGR